MKKRINTKNSFDFYELDFLEENCFELYSSKKGEIFLKKYRWMFISYKTAKIYDTKRKPKIQDEKGYFVPVNINRRIF